MSDFHLGLKQFLLEQTTTSSVSPFLKDEELPVSFQGYQMSQPSSVTKTSGQPIGSHDYGSVKPAPKQRRGNENGTTKEEWGRIDTNGDGIPDDIGEFDVFAYDADNDYTFPQTWDEYNDWFHHYFVFQQETMLQTMFLLSGTNSISGLSGTLGAPGGGITTAEQYLFQLYWILSGHVLGDENVFNSGNPFSDQGFCWGCVWGGDNPFPFWQGYDYNPTWGSYGDPDAIWSPEDMYPQN